MKPRFIVKENRAGAIWLTVTFLVLVGFLVVLAKNTSLLALSEDLLFDYFSHNTLSLIHFTDPLYSLRFGLGLADYSIFVDGYWGASTFLHRFIPTAHACLIVLISVICDYLGCLSLLLFKKTKLSLKKLLTNFVVVISLHAMLAFRFPELFLIIALCLRISVVEHRGTIIEVLQFLLFCWLSLYFLPGAIAFFFGRILLDLSHQNNAKKSDKRKFARLLFAIVCSLGVSVIEWWPLLTSPLYYRGIIEQDWRQFFTALSLFLGMLFLFISTKDMRGLLKTSGKLTATALLILFLTISAFVFGSSLVHCSPYCVLSVFVALSLLPPKNENKKRDAICAFVGVVCGTAALIVSKSIFALPIGLILASLFFGLKKMGFENPVYIDKSRSSGRFIFPLTLSFLAILSVIGSGRTTSVSAIRQTTLVSSEVFRNVTDLRSSRLANDGLNSYPEAELGWSNCINQFARRDNYSYFLEKAGFTPDSISTVTINSLLGIKYIVSENEVFSWERVYSGLDFSIYENPFAFPLIFSVGKEPTQLSIEDSDNRFVIQNKLIQCFFGDEYQNLDISVPTNESLVPVFDCTSENYYLLFDETAIPANIQVNDRNVRIRDAVLDLGKNNLGVGPLTIRSELPFSIIREDLTILAELRSKVAKPLFSFEGRRIVSKAEVWSGEFRRWLVFTTPYDKKWRAYRNEVHNLETKQFALFESAMIEDGSSRFAFLYQEPNYRGGFFVGVLCLGAFASVAIVVGVGKKEKDEK